MDDEYILSHGGTEEDIASYAHDNGACPKKVMSWLYCDYCDKSKEYYMNLDDLYIAKDVQVFLKDTLELLITNRVEIWAIFKILPEDSGIFEKLAEYHKRKSIPLACEIADDLYKLYN